VALHARIDIHSKYLLSLLMPLFGHGRAVAIYRQWASRMLQPSQVLCQCLRTVGTLKGGCATPDRVIWEWTDDAGGFIRASNWINAAANLGTVDVPLQAASNAQLTFSTAATPAVSPFAPVAAQYHLVTDIAVLIFATAAATTFQVVVPGPMVAVFGPTSNVVDPLAPLTAALIAGVIGTLTDAVGNVATAFVSGVKSSRRTEQT
jgi:hypothetical protein